MAAGALLLNVRISPSGLIDTSLGYMADARQPMMTLLSDEFVFKEGSVCSNLTRLLVVWKLCARFPLAACAERRSASSSAL